MGAGSRQPWAEPAVPGYVTEAGLAKSSLVPKLQGDAVLPNNPAASLRILVSNYAVMFLFFLTHFFFFKSE